MLIRLPNPCPTCGGPVTYAGRGRRPDYCSRDCRAAQRATDKREARAAAAAPPVEVPDAVAALVQRRRERVATVPRVAVRRAAGDDFEHVDRLAEEAFGEGAERFDLGAAGYVVDGYAARTAKRRENDEAARWLAEHHPAALHDFPADF
ncbi:hypothetical protein GA0074695_1537 [Micromonospora viridifaciens]|uniref:Uncharacterized protein n=1 Tax=Micromonospora viridifaciens TaxID=1881 RepID=A0A1C4VJQ4_MICVI|nr:hypothetical protein [Micromonospora viridifaciens]SCE84237.1 hypothetical protein GA0074695_1537 [Micromonospora viridifaciens]